MEWINEWIPQIGAGVFSLLATVLVCTKGKLRRWGYPVGLLAQPFWYWMTATTGQWVIFALSIFYTVSWINGFRNHFLRKEAVEGPESLQRAKDALGEALDYLESDLGPRGELLGCCVPHSLYREWHRLSGKNKEDVCAE